MGQLHGHRRRAGGQSSYLGGVAHQLAEGCQGADDPGVVARRHVEDVASTSAEVRQHRVHVVFVYCDLCGGGRADRGGDEGVLILF